MHETKIVSVYGLGDKCVQVNFGHSKITGRPYVLEWLNENTVGDFHCSWNNVVFQNSADASMFLLKWVR